MENSNDLNLQMSPPSNQPESSGLSSVSELVKRSIETYKANVWKFLGMSFVIPMLGALPLVVVLMVYIILSYAEVGGIFIGLLFTLLGLAAVMILLATVYISGVGKFILFKNIDKDPGVIRSFKNSIPFAWGFVVVSLTTAFFTILWTLLFIVPGIIAAIRYSFAPWAYIFEGYKGRTALNRSKELVKNNIWWIIGLFILMAFASFVLYIPAIVLKDTPMITFIMQIINILLGPLWFIFMGYIYKDLVRIKGEPSSDFKKDISGITVVGKVIIIILFLCVIIIAIPLLIAKNKVNFNYSQSNNQLLEDGMPGGFYPEDNMFNSEKYAEPEQRDAKRYSDIKKLEAALKMYHSENDYYPDYLMELTPTFIPSLPSDPKNILEYYYRINYDDKSDYNLCFDMETQYMDSFKTGKNCVNSFGETVDIIEEVNSNNIIDESFDNAMVGEEIYDDANIDTDSDGLNDLEEKSIGTDLFNPDTDGDGFSDFEEINKGYDPLMP